ncbi:MAG: hypothetical protein HXY34_06325, partial [Candidatus Thorarchaeota archaeon]|nr:hypothetical protein [Candidatus Thorarchaeota archaeon]
MLEYREFPFRRAVYYVLTAPVLSCFLLAVTRLMSGELFPGNPDQLLMLGCAAGASAVTVLVGGLVADHTDRTEVIIIVASTVPVGLSIAEFTLGYPNQYSPTLDWALALSVFCGLGLLLLCWGVQLNETMVIRFRGRTVGGLFTLTLVLYGVYGWLPSAGMPLVLAGLPLPEL